MSELIEKQNSLGDFALGVQTQQNQIARADTVKQNLRNYMVTNDRNLLSALYCENGLVQTLIRQPVDDAYRGGVEPISEQLNSSDIETLKNFMDEMGVLDEYKMARYWGRLFGGAGLIINAEQDPSKEFNIDLVTEKSNIEFYAADRWELNYQASGEINKGVYARGESISDIPYDYYGTKLHKSRVLRIVGERAPSILSLQLMGWGMSEVERLLRSLNSYTKNQDVIFELLDEAKIDVFKKAGFNTALASQGGTEKVTKQATVANQLKNYLNALIIDNEDDYQQKQMAFSGLGDILTQIRQGVACDMRMPITKLFGVSSSGFNSGEDDLENYNSMIEAEIRAKDKKNLIMIMQICCKKCFNDIPDDLNFELPPLRVLSAEQEQNVKNSEFGRLMQAIQQGVITDKEFIAAVNKNNLLPLHIGGSNASA